MINSKNAVACLGSLLMLSVSTPVFAEEKAPEGKDLSRKMKVSRYDETARGLNAPLYDYYAAKIKEKAGIAKGACLDVGSGGGYLGLALAKVTDLDITFLDISEAALEKAKQHIVEDGLQKRARTLLADVHKIPLPDGAMNLVISRGSIPFWKDPVAGLKEIYRVLAPGGRAYVITGKATPEIQAQIAAKRKAAGLEAPTMKSGVAKAPRHGNSPARDFNELLKDSGIAHYSVVLGEDGRWIMLWK